MFIMIYMGLGRWWMALIVFFGILVSASGGFVMLYFWGANLSVAVWVGFIALFGVVDDAAVVMLDFLQEQFKTFHPRDVKEIREKIVESALQRFRPMLMSTATTVIGLMPVLMVTGRGSDVMQPMAIPSVGGMTVQIITLFIAPCLFCMAMEWEYKRGWLSREDQGDEEAGVSESDST
jgi:Cu(I)/Ag(I) efflux system membrane protein CusA/SilA